MKYLILIFVFLSCNDRYHDENGNLKVAPIQAVHDTIFFNDRNSVVYLHDTVYIHDIASYELMINVYTKGWLQGATFANYHCLKKDFSEKSYDLGRWKDVSDFKKTLSH